MSISKTKRAALVPPLVSPARDWVSLILAIAGCLLALYLWHAHRSGSVLGCPPGGGCDLVQQSRWAILWGVPIAAWGAGFYGFIAVIAGWRTLAARQNLLLLLTTCGFGISLYLNFVTWRELRVSCPYCLVSLSLLGTLAAVAWWRAQPGYRIWLGALAGLVTVVSVAGLHQSFGGYAQALSGPENRYLRTLAEHLTRSGARFYGASWCPHCQHQKALFGPASKRLPYVECSPFGPGAPQATDCQTANINNYPTWVIRERRQEKMLSVPELAALSGFSLPPAVEQPK